jgi:hypothetical protein
MSDTPASPPLLIRRKIAHVRATERLPPERSSLPGWIAAASALDFDSTALDGDASCSTDLLALGRALDLIGFAGRFRLAAIIHPLSSNLPILYSSFHRNPKLANGISSHFSLPVPRCEMRRSSFLSGG